MWRFNGRAKRSIGRMLFHPNVVHFPIALWLTSTFFDLLGLRREKAIFREMAFWLVGLGLVGAAVSILFGWTDLLAQERQGVATGVLLRHRVHSWLAYSSTAAYLGVFVWRWRTEHRLSPGALLLSLLGAGLVAVAGYLGGEMRNVM
ncbi:MAG: DUF2231 domain-containing protein [Bacillati bacterium ANGP1]|uniref:DUF2231 domain-containing protein n=1 Tax=Candidatus Segetimicrobium genomatis TaxID=2569760 RepID=A0A537JA58_9BACT|nr:MAG: DUF2231 domain-containing protein [Terrabacteria group bacterium ANGP1]